MPPIETSDLYQPAIYWAIVGYDGDGEPKVSDTPEQLYVRWERNAKEFINPNGLTIRVDAAAAVPCRTKEGSLLKPGLLQDLAGTAMNDDGEELMQVVAYKEALDLKGRNTRREVGLRKFRGTLPTEASDPEAL